MPGSNPDGTSVPVETLDRKNGQELELIAAYVQAGKVVSPPGDAKVPVTFDLQNTSAFQGIAMNYGKDKKPDFELEKKGGEKKAARRLASPSPS